MNLLAIDIGNTNIKIGLFLDDSQTFIKSIPGKEAEKLFDEILHAWEQIPFAERSKDNLRNGVIIVSSVKPEWTELVEKICKDAINEKIKLVGREINLPMEMGVDDYRQVGTDRVIAAAAAYAVVQDAVVVADFGSAVTIDLVDEQGVFLGGVIAPGFGIAAKSLADNTAQLPLVKVIAANDPVGANTNDAINAGLYFSAVGLLRTVTEKYAEQLGKWPQTIITGADAEIIKKDCDFVDSWVSDLTLTGIVLAYKKHLDVQSELEDYAKEDAESFENENNKEG